MTMKKFKNIVFIALATLTLSNCAQKKAEFVALPPQLQNHITSSEAYVEQCQKKMMAAIESSHISEGTGSLLLAAIDVGIMTYRQNCAEDAMCDMQKELTQYGLQAKFQEKLEQTLREAAWLHMGAINHIAELNDEAIENARKSTKADALLTIKFSYRLDAKFNAITGTLHVDLYPTGDKWKGKLAEGQDDSSPIMKFRLTSSEALPFRVMSIEENAKRWLDNDAEYLKKALNTILRNLYIQMKHNSKHPDEIIDLYPQQPQA